MGGFAQMSPKVSAVLRMTDYGPAIWCPGCGHAHVFNETGRAPAGAPTWTFDGNAERPTFAPSMLVFTPEWTDERGKVYPRRTRCHSFVGGGRIQFLADCMHKFAGQTVDLPKWPEFES